MRILLLITICICGIAVSVNAQDDPMDMANTGLPTSGRSKSSSERNQQSRERTKVSRTPIAGTINRTKEEPAQNNNNAEEERLRNFRSDTTQVRNYDQKGKPISTPYSVLTPERRRDSVKVTTPATQPQRSPAKK